MQAFDKTDLTDKMSHGYNRNTLVLLPFWHTGSSVINQKFFLLFSFTSECGIAGDCSGFVGISLQMPVNNFQIAVQTLCWAAYKSTGIVLHSSNRTLAVELVTLEHCL